jgi:hypothetical protein
MKYKGAPMGRFIFFKKIDFFSWNKRFLSYICKPKTGETLRSFNIEINTNTAGVAQLARAADL